MWKVSALLLTLLVAFVIWFGGFGTIQKSSVAVISPISVSQAPETVKGKSTLRKTQSIFIPYWGFQNEMIQSDSSDELIYFGISVDEKGIDTKDLGYKKIDEFVRLVDSSKARLLVLRMTDSKTNFSVLKNKRVQQDIINGSIRIAKQYGFSGLVLDLELRSIPFESITSQINAFVKEFSQKARKEQIELSLALFGDTFYRIRPYDVVFLSKHTDRIFIMAYDFHKSNGTAGPNFPLSGVKTYGYDFKTMTSDFLNIVPKEKLVVVFGLFGYDWIVGEEYEGKPAQSLSFLQIKQKFLDFCQFKNCSVQRDVESSEQKIGYTDSALQKHIVWFEDMESVERKKEFLKEKGIEQVSFWAHSFF